MGKENMLNATLQDAVYRYLITALIEPRRHDTQQIGQAGIINVL